MQGRPNAEESLWCTGKTLGIRPETAGFKLPNSHDSL